ncbi:phage late control D family protein [Cohnella sp. JJ-181]|uniref:phage late control D family protein n=1 Tax=Cohnella rhizoplanae TaxID=2974897 RepID=UPI0022FF6FC0|nr:contractile injection system protein, VgrG/Pvc8 family [Cohnella sp. JJ-181]CAI6081404.1 hypothetical protein COHCIP112018_03298 [Cohnella sp. JJ-181]
MTVKFDTTTYDLAALESKYRSFFAPSFEILIDGQNLVRLGAAVPSLRVTSRTGMFSDHFNFRIVNAFDPVARSLKWMGSLVDVGKSITINMGYTDRFETVFEGIVTGVGVDYPTGGLPVVSVKGMDKSMLMMRSKQSSQWKDKQASDVVKQIAAKYGLTPVVDDTMTPIPRIEQHRVSDFHFLHSLAFDNERDFMVIGSKLYFKKRNTSAAEVLTLTYGKSLLSYTAEVDISNQVTQVVVRGIDPDTHQAIEAKSRAVDVIGTNGRSGPNIVGALSSYLIETEFMEYTTVAAAQKLADSMMHDKAMELVTGSGTCIGLPEMRAGRFIKLENVGRQFSQPMLLSNVTHAIDTSGFVTSFNVEGNAI